MNTQGAKIEHLFVVKKIHIFTLIHVLRHSERYFIYITAKLLKGKTRKK